MADIRKRNGNKRITYQVRYRSKTAESGYAYKTFFTLMEARQFRESAETRTIGSAGRQAGVEWRHCEAPGHCLSMKQPRYLGLEEARQVLAGIGVKVTLRQMQRAANQDAQGRRKLPFFLDPIEHRLKIEKDDLLGAYFRRQVEAQRNLRQN